MHISSPAFSDGEMIPRAYTAEGRNVSPPLQFGDVPPETRSLALIVEDPDAPHGTFTHWIVWGMKPDRRILEEDRLPPEAVELSNGHGKPAYFGPRPPSGTHRYFFRLYALDAVFRPPRNTQRFHEVIADHVLEEASVMGRYRHEEETAKAA